MDYSELLANSGFKTPDANQWTSFEVKGLPENIARSFSQVHSTQLGAVLKGKGSHGIQ